ncbi:MULTISPECIES: PEP-CTERM sorting domain-containing protein [Rugamonas]|uniref:PEP-CTERM protein-sorting domain-containing protein n=1 Tax=Rugamonas rubra TaxID=758825 RepID=A0A1I4I311_9BURK|nr:MULTISPECIES: PEP-CTERM sorting domain-containing protein [Rugamonas]WGG51362.1 PEP-CTERM sorting domain-containing protein [Rugamonas sp. DEMB1]SFL48620.1 PEP-CTERM protein-sorting domain-containing protein [Rugamonas rubra]
MTPRHLLRPWRRLAALCCLLAGWTGGATAAGVLYDNGGPDGAGANNAGIAWQADDFVLGGGAVLSDLHFWTFEAAGAYRNSIAWAIAADAGGTVGALLASGQQGAVARSATGAVQAGLDGYQYGLDLNAPLALAAGRYWLVLHNGGFGQMGDPNDFYWATAAANGGPDGRESYNGGASWGANGSEHAFQLTGVVPEPSPAALLGAGLAVLLLRRRVGARRADDVGGDGGGHGDGRPAAWGRS